MNNLRVLITGGAGLLGRTLIATAPLGIDLHATERHHPIAKGRAIAHRVELSDQVAVARLFAQLRPELVIHTAYSMHAGERDIWQATRLVVAGGQEVGADLIHLSSDVIFDGEKAPYSEEDEPEPVHEYGHWKSKVEWYVRQELPQAAIVRTSLITQFSPLDPRSAWVADSLREGKAIRLYVDELRCPIEVTDLAKQLWEIAAKPTHERAGIWHLVGAEAISRYALGLLIAAHEGLDSTGITPALNASSPIPRPRDLRLLTTRADQALQIKARPISVLALAKAIGESSCNR